MYLNELIVDPCSAVKYMLNHEGALNQLVTNDTNLAVMLLTVSKKFTEIYQEEITDI